jgi:hypothetical protein
MAGMGKRDKVYTVRCAACATEETVERQHGEKPMIRDEAVAQLLLMGFHLVKGEWLCSRHPDDVLNTP